MTRTRSVLAIGAVALALAAGLLLLAREPPRASLPDAAPARPTETAGARAVPSSPAPVRGGATPPSARRDGSDPESSPTLAPGPAPRPAPPRVVEVPEMVELYGSVELFDIDGVRLPPPGGSFRLHLAGAVEDRAVEVRVEAGGWSRPVPAGARVRADRFDLDGRGALPVGDRSWQEVGRGRCLPLAAQRLPTIELDVVAQGSNDPVRRIVVARVPEAEDEPLGWMRRPPPYPGPRSTLDGVASAGASPVVLPDPVVSLDDGLRPVVDYWVRADGRAWTHVGVDHGQPGARRVELPAGGDLEVSLVGHDPHGLQRLSLTRGGRTWESTTLGKPARVTFDGLEAGPYSVEVRADWPPDLQLAYRDVVVRAGETTTLEMYVAREPATDRPTALGGRLVVPEAWTSWAPGALLLRAELVRRGGRGGSHVIDFSGETLPPVEGREGTYTFRRDDVPPGEYVLTVVPIGYRTRVTVAGLFGKTDIGVEVPEPVPVRLTVRASDGSVSPSDALSWSARHASGRDLPAWADVERLVRRAPDAEAFEFPAPPGPLRLSIPGAGDAVTVVVDAERPEIELRLRD